MAVPERETDVPALRALAGSLGGHLSTAELRTKVQEYFAADLGQWNILSNRESGRNIVHLDLVRLQIQGDDGTWLDFQDRLAKEGPQPPQRLRITERGRLLLDGLPLGAAIIPDGFEELIAEKEMEASEQLYEAGEVFPVPDVSDGQTAPKEGEIPEAPPQAPRAGQYRADPAARRQALERRNDAHHALVLEVRRRAEAARLQCTQTRYADALVRAPEFGALFEMKTVAADSHDLVRQVRHAIGQLYHYRFIHRKSNGFEHGVRLFAVFDAPIPEELVDFLRDINIGTLCCIGSKFHGDPMSLRDLPWLFS